MDLRKVKKLIELVEESGITELEVRDGEETIRIARHPAPPGAAVQPTAPSVTSQRPAGPRSPGSGFEVRSPMAGTFYRAPAPEEEPFVAVGSAVSAGDVLCIIESMKMMNEIRADRAGVVTAVAVENGQAVGSGQVLFLFE
ncbi:MAG: acetyl-CoA carboxylase biotin carboxyl carrier protein [Pseudomonadales bacterium]